MVKDANLEHVSEWLGCKMKQSSPEIHKQLATATHTQPGLLLFRKKTIREFRMKAPQLCSWDARFQRAAEIESDIATFFEKGAAKGKDDLEEDALAQLSFQNEYLKPLNGIPWVIAIIAAFKIWVVPTMTIMTPILAWILPYLLLRFVYSLPIDQSQYLSILRGLWSGNFSSPFPSPGDPIPSLFTTKSVAQFALFGFSFIQSMLQPIQNAMHLYRTDSIFRDLGAKLVELRTIVNGFRRDLTGIVGERPHMLSETLDVVDAADVRRGFFAIAEDPTRVHLVFKDLANLEILWRVAQKEALNPVRFEINRLALEDAVDISLKPADAVPGNLELGQEAQAHAVITGPNGGGKSSFLRSVLQSVLLGHAYGYAPAKTCSMPRFLWIASGLQLRDTPGVYSMFETEVKFAADSLKYAYAPVPNGPGLVLFDELFHSTNPPDSARTAGLFLKNLWGAPKNSVFSVVSTHLFPLIENAPENVKAICCPAKETAAGDIEYTYTVQPGVCRVSSVKKVWERFGLFHCGQGASAKTSPSKRTLPEENDK